MRTQQGTLGLTIGFGVMIALLLTMMILGLNRMANQHEYLQHHITEYEQEKKHIYTMYKAARERTVALLNYIILSDPFEKDAQLIRFREVAEDFIKARNAVLDSDLNETQRELLARQSRLSTINVPLQNLVVELFQDGKMEEARTLLFREVIPLQEGVLSTLQAFLDYEEEEAALSLEQASVSYYHGRTFLILSGLITIMLGIFIAVSSVRQSRLAAQNLLNEKERAQTTLFSIGDAVITTNAMGMIDMVNPGAEKILGQSRQQLIGQHFSHISELFENREPINIPLMQAMVEGKTVYSPKAIDLHRRDQANFAIEYTAAPILDSSGKSIGGILTMRDVTEMHQLSAKLHFQACHDALTGLLNRREFESRLDAAIESSRHESLTHILLYMDLDQFKVVNDTCGHNAGDELLKQLAPLLKPLIRGNDVLARLGGDEFGILLEGCNPDKGLQIAERLKQTVKDYRFNWKNNVFEIGVSIGLVEINANSGNSNEVMSAADSACYVAKDLGRNHIHIYRPDDAALISRQGEMQWLPAINDAIAKDRFTLFYQPIIPIGDNEQPMMYEFLIRLQEEDGTVVPPMAFIPAAERYNLASALDRWVVGKAIEFLSDNSNNPVLSNSLFTINLSAQSLSDQQSLDYVLHCLQKYDTQPSQICFEITETAAIANLSSAMEFISVLRHMGCRFALDDFGSGLSSYGYLKNLNVDFIKIDGNFIRNIDEDNLNQAFVTSISQIAGIMGIQTIAEFVETEAAADFLKETGINYMQGHWLGKPRPIEGLLYDNETDPQRHLIHTI
ncbi:MAG: EAL domain-containing protein [Gammaproteobacteria bacterium]|nr:EAL domain-containing protein [Gammaproteobacteria bacterium]